MKENFEIFVFLERHEPNGGYTWLQTLTQHYNQHPNPQAPPGGTRGVFERHDEATHWIETYGERGVRYTIIETYSK